MAERSLRLRLGLFVAVCLAALVGLVILFGGRPTLFTNRARYVVTFPEAPGIAVGTPVRKSGVRVGDVTSLDLDESTSQVRVNVELDRKYGPRGGEDAVISRGLLSGDTALDFVPKTGADGNPSTRGDILPPGSVVEGVPPVNPRVLLSQASGAIPNAQESLLKIVQTAQRIEQAVPKLERTADEFSGLARAGREFVPELRQTNTKVQELLGANVDPADPQTNPATVRDMLREVVALLRAIRPVAEDLRTLTRDNGPEVTQTLRSVRRAADATNDLLNPDNRKAAANTLKNLQAASADLTTTIRLVGVVLDQADKTLKEFNARAVQSERALSNIERITRPFAEQADDLSRGAGETVKNLNAASVELSRALAEARKTLEAVNRSDGTLQKVVADPALYNNLNAAAVELARTLARAEKVARDLEVFADKVARKPETIGIGGALRPSTGLKESPTAPLPSTPLPPVPPTTGTTASPQPPTVAPITPIAPVPSYRVPSDLPPG